MSHLKASWRRRVERGLARLAARWQARPAQIDVEPAALEQARPRVQFL